MDYVLTLRLLHTTENYSSAMSQKATIEGRVLHAALMYSTSLSEIGYTVALWVPITCCKLNRII